MTNTICFSNQGEIDIDAVTTMGVSVKPTSEAIGFFGTGLKYAIAVLLREGQSIRVRSGLVEFSFFLRVKKIRGEDFQIVHMSTRGAREARSLAFTTSYGRNWTLENVYRELWSNMKDESGRVSEGPPEPAAEGQTQIIVEGAEFRKVHEKRAGFILAHDRKLLDKTPDLEVYLGVSQQVFYRGIAALKLDKPTMFTYNFTKRCELTEDRTLAGGTWRPQCDIPDWIMLHAPEEFVGEVVCAGEDYFEHGLRYSTYLRPSEAFKSGVHRAFKERGLKLNGSAADLFFKETRERKVEFAEYEPSAEEALTLAEGLERVARWGYDYSRFGFKVKLVEFAGENIVARVNGADEMVMRRNALEDMDLLDAALIEEFIHLRFKCDDHTRHMQNILFGEIIRLARKLDALGEAVGEPLSGPLEPIPGSLEPEACPSVIAFPPPEEDEIPF